MSKELSFLLGISPQSINFSLQQTNSFIFLGSFRITSNLTFKGLYLINKFFLLLLHKDDLHLHLPIFLLQLYYLIPEDVHIVILGWLAFLFLNIFLHFDYVSLRFKQFCLEVTGLLFSYLQLIFQIIYIQLLFHPSRTLLSFL